MNWDPYELVDDWLTARVYPSVTLTGYRADVGAWLDHCRTTDTAWDKAAPGHIALWAHEPGAPHRRTARRVSAVRSFYAYALDRGAVVHNPVERRPGFTNPAQLSPATLDPRQIAVLLAALDERGERGGGRTRSRHPHPLQDRACGYLLVGLGLRAALVTVLVLDDLSTEGTIGLGADTLRLPDPSGGHHLVPLPPLVREAVNAYLPHRVPPRDPARGGPLFTGRTGAKMPQRHPHDLLRSVATASGLLSAGGISSPVRGHAHT
jgi:site-specific recombinase XerD